MFLQLANAYRELGDEDRVGMTAPAQIGAMFVDWTDPQTLM
jgi:hypothetical protein